MPPKKLCVNNFAEKANLWSDTQPSKGLLQGLRTRRFTVGILDLLFIPLWQWFSISKVLFEKKRKPC